jgi:hypothetical protein
MVSFIDKKDFLLRLTGELRGIFWFAPFIAGHVSDCSALAMRESETGTLGSVSAVSVEKWIR